MTDWLNAEEVRAERAKRLEYALIYGSSEEQRSQLALAVLKAIAALPEPTMCEFHNCESMYTELHRIWLVAREVVG